MGAPLIQSPNKLKGRPSEFTLERAAAYLHVIRTQAKSNNEISLENPDFPEPETIYKWIGDSVEFGQAYLHAKRCQVQAYLDRCFDLAFTRCESPVEAAQLKIQVDLIKWWAARLCPRLYGERLMNEEKEIIKDDVLETVKKMMDKALIEHKRDY